MKRLTISLLLAALFSVTNASAGALDQVMLQLQAQGAQTGDAQQGAAMWEKSFSHNKGPQQRSCSSCHTKNLKNIGKHVKTKKRIEPMAVSVNPERLSKAKKIAKWLKRNCKWTLGRECSAQEKADFLAFIRSQ